MTSTTVNVLLLHAAVVLVVLLPQAYSYHYSLDAEELDHLVSPSSLSSSSSPGTSISQTSLRKKRVSQISCQCCSNSFNSHCCLKCMQRVGKRSPAYFNRREHPDHLLEVAPLQNDVLPFSAEERYRMESIMPSSISGNEDDVIQLEDGYPWERQCGCCLNQIRDFPQAMEWPCCIRCLSRRR
ncbi:hypothetical protein PoB_004105400 [Plakobranchus ocellatus]|uniref:Uncharacterized protein n=1 Tax=Plakobranchus ocellatus TaxID=259542 RepID=A0AAV4B868_9GAST|nr:hypothetical protein PoB_004105400 [Plakobranchus ocellatus]